MLVRQRTPTFSKRDKKVYSELNLEETKPESRFKKYLFPLAFIVGAVVIAVLLHMAKPKVVEEKTEFPPLTVDVAEATLDESVLSSIFQGSVRAKTDIELVTQVTGKVVSVSDKFIEGGQFEKGDVILKIDDSDYRVALKSAQARVAEAKVELDLELAAAENNKKEWQRLVGESLENADPLRLNKPQVQRARARLDAAKAQLAQAQLDFNRTRVKAPFSGRLTNKTAEVGQFISRGSSVGRIFSTDSVEIRIPMSDLQISELGIGLGQIPDAKKKLPAKVLVQFGKQDYAWNGYLKSIDASIDKQTRLLYGTVVVDQPFKANQNLPLAPGMFVDVELAAAKKVSGVRVPRTALRSGNRVYVIENNKLVFKQADTLFTSPEIAVLDVKTNSAVLPGDKVIISAVPGAFEGMSVESKQQLVASLDATEQSQPTELQPQTTKPQPQTTEPQAQTVEAETQASEKAAESVEVESSGEEAKQEAVKSAETAQPAVKS